MSLDNQNSARNQKNNSSENDSDYLKRLEQKL